MCIRDSTHIGIHGDVYKVWSFELCLLLMHSSLTQTQLCSQEHLQPSSIGPSTSSASSSHGPSASNASSTSGGSSSHGHSPSTSDGCHVPRVVDPVYHNDPQLERWRQLLQRHFYQVKMQESQRPPTLEERRSLKRLGLLDEWKIPGCLCAQIIGIIPDIDPIRQLYHFSWILQFCTFFCLGTLICGYHGASVICSFLLWVQSDHTASFYLILRISFFCSLYLMMDKYHLMTTSFKQSTRNDTTHTAPLKMVPKPLK